MSRRSKRAFDEAYIAGLKPSEDGKRYSRFDSQTQGLGVHVQGSGTKAYFFQGRPLGSINQKPYPIGPIDLISLGEAQKTAREYREAIFRGDDPRRAKRDAQENTLFKLITDYCETKGSKRSRRTIERVLHIDWMNMEPAAQPVPDVGSGTSRMIKWFASPSGPAFLRDDPITKIDLIDLIDRIKQIRKDRGKWAARTAKSNICAAFAWCFRNGSHGLLKNVALGLTNEHAGFTSSKEMRRKRVLTDDELRRVWNATNELGTYGKIVQLLILTGARLREIGSAEWKELDGNILIVPPERYKTDEEHRIPLTPIAMEIVAGLTKSSPYLFTSNGRNPFTQYPRYKRKLDRISGVTGYVIHDLRRTVRTNLSKLRIAPHICEGILGHAQKGIVETYNRYDFLDEKKEALIQWQNALAISRIRPRYCLPTSPGSPP